MMLGVRRPAGFDYGAPADNEDSGDTSWGQCKRLRSSGPTLCSLNTNCVDIPETWPNAVAPEEASCGGGVFEDGIQRRSVSGEAEPVVGSLENPTAREAELQERPGKNKSAKLMGNVDLRRSPRLAKVTISAEGSTGAASPPQLLAPLGALGSDDSEASKDVFIVTHDKSELEVVGSSKGFNTAAEPLQSSASFVPGKERKQDCSTKARSKKSTGNVAHRWSPGLVKCTAHSNECDLTADLPVFSTSPRTPTFGTFAPPDNLGSDACKEKSVGRETVEPSAFSEKAKSPGTSARLKIRRDDLLHFSNESRPVEECDSALQRQSFQLANQIHQGNKEELSIVLALPHFSPRPGTQNSYTVKFLNNSSSGARKTVSLRSQATKPVIPLDKVGPCESFGIWKPGCVEMMKCSGEGKLTEKPINVSGRQSLEQLMKDAVHGNVCDPSEPSPLPDLRGCLATQNILNSVICKEASPGSKSMEVMRCLGKFEGPPESWEICKRGNMAGETGSLEDSNNDCQDQSLRLEQDGDFDSRCGWSRKLCKPMSIRKTKVMQAPRNYQTQRIISGHGSQDKARICKEESLSITSTVNDQGKKKEVQCKEIVTRKMVKETLRLFQAICRKLLREEESKAREPCHCHRVDVMALNLIKEKGKCLNVGEHHFGNVPGVEIGDEFHYRAELSIIGLHRNIMAGINYAKHDGMYVASSIVIYEGYFDFLERSDLVLYSGSAGNPNYYYRNKSGKLLGDQKLERGNLALKNSMDVQIPIRVVLGLKEPKATDCRFSKAKGTVTYVYDGLYLVEKYWSEMGNHGFSIFKFQLRRMSGQRQLAIKEIQNSKGFKLQRGLRMEDISWGKENIPVGIVNTIDENYPLPFRYINKVIYPSWYKLTSPKGCDCTDGCSDSVNCACAVKNGGEIPFNYDGAIVEAKPLVYECGPSCNCPPSCHNRVSQHGIKYPLEVFKTKSMGWGVRSLTSIPSGSFICEYTGEMIEESEANRRSNDDYLFDIGQNYYDRSLWEGLSTCIPGLQQDASCEAVEDECFTIDAANCGNIGRFINHCCSPNVYAQNVLYDHDDKRMPHIMFFAAENISPLEEVTYHYNYTIDQVRDLDGNIKKKNCHCGSVECTGRLY